MLRILPFSRHYEIWIVGEVVGTIKQFYDEWWFLAIDDWQPTDGQREIIYNKIRELNK
jgi:hypothetical protein